MEWYFLPNDRRESFMGREIWGTYSVRDHTLPGAFLADLMFYDRLVLPVPQPGEEADWERENWAPANQAGLIEELARFDRVKTVPWRLGTWEREKENFTKDLAERSSLDIEVARDVARDAFLFTRTRLIEDLPRHVRGVTAVPTFADAGTLAGAIGLQRGKAGELNMSAQSMAAAAMRLKFLAPKPDGRTRLENLVPVLEKTGEKDVRKARDAFWRWQRDFFGDDVVTEQASLDAAAEEMADLIADLERALRWDRIRTAAQYLFLAGGATVGMLGGPLTPVALAGVALSVGQFAFDKVADTNEIKRAPDAALFTSAKTGLPFQFAADE